MEPDVRNILRRYNRARVERREKFRTAALWLIVLCLLFMVARDITIGLWFQRVAADFEAGKADADQKIQEMLERMP